MLEDLQEVNDVKHLGQHTYPAEELGAHKASPEESKRMEKEREKERKELEKEVREMCQGKTRAKLIDHLVNNIHAFKELDKIKQALWDGRNKLQLKNIQQQNDLAGKDKEISFWKKQAELYFEALQRLQEQA